MAKIVLDMSMSLDGFIAGPNNSTEHPLGVDGHRLHDWLNVGSGDPAPFRPTAEPSAAVFDEVMATGAVIAGRHTYDLAGGWNGDHHDGLPIFTCTSGSIASVLVRSSDERTGRRCQAHSRLPGRSCETC
jgi:dihydrofolate reductase